MFFRKWSPRESVRCTGLMWDCEGTQARIWVDTYDFAINVFGVEATHHLPSRDLDHADVGDKMRWTLQKVPP